MLACSIYALMSQRPRRSWSTYEDNILRRCVEANPDNPRWCDISKYLPGRNPKDCRKRWVSSLNASLTKGPWTSGEDVLLTTAVEQYGSDWAAVSRAFAGRRSGDQCSKRWRQVVNPSINRDPWSAEDDRLLLQLYGHHKNSWQLISTHFSNRTDLQCRNRYCRLLGTRSLAKNEKRSSTPTTQQTRPFVKSTFQGTSNTTDTMFFDETQPNSYSEPNAEDFNIKPAPSVSQIPALVAQTSPRGEHLYQSVFGGTSPLPNSVHIPISHHTSMNEQSYAPNAYQPSAQLLWQARGAESSSSTMSPQLQNASFGPDFPPSQSSYPSQADAFSVVSFDSPYPSEQFFYHPGASYTPSMPPTKQHWPQSGDFSHSHANRRRRLGPTPPI
ncbi:hypothetical protein D9757_004777 [Collybiopsis confluens]|uniref:Uncharacterized protein n=1 Tax=Collybiopsis confluens TaxID=2823264 RepID=A0A8H5HSG3_9AGAR|nr:hypothetical protein D9757_004777 [Collybiopsis confluens]